MFMRIILKKSVARITSDIYYSASHNFQDFKNA